MRNYNITKYKGNKRIIKRLEFSEISLSFTLLLNMLFVKLIIRETHIMLDQQGEQVIVV